jgi:hypothetical protein
MIYSFGHPTLGGHPSRNMPCSPDLFSGLVSKQAPALSAAARAPFSQLLCTNRVKSTANSFGWPMSWATLRCPFCLSALAPSRSEPLMLPVTSSAAQPMRSIARPRAKSKSRIVSSERVKRQQTSTSLRLGACHSSRLAGG